MTDSDHSSEALHVGPVTKTFTGNRALDAVSLSLQSGRIHALLGGNGSGKSTLIKVLAGIEQADDDAVIRVGGRSAGLLHWSARDARAAGLRFVHQDLSLFPELSVTENLLMQPKIDGAVRGWISWRRLNRVAQEVLDRFDVRVDARTTLSELTAVEKVQVAAARALKDVEEGSQAVIVLDEPTAYLPPRESDQLLSSIQGYADRGAAVVIVTHRLGEVISVCQDVTVLRQGRVVASREIGSTNEDDLSFLITNERIASGDEGRGVLDSGAGVAPRLRARGVGDAFDIAVRPGEIVGVVDAGGVTARALIRGLAGAAELDADVTLDGAAYAPRSPREAVVQGVVLVPGDRLGEAAFPGLSMAQNTTIVRQHDFSRAGFADRKRERRATDELIGEYRVSPASQDLDIGGFSGGNQQKIVVGRWLALEPALLLLEEPTQGVDVAARHHIWERIGARADAGGGVLVLSSDFQELAARCNRVIVFSHGRISRTVEGPDLTQATIESAVHAA
jgi:ribose transport system ATP-binding protein